MNEVTVLAKIWRENTQQIRIEFDRKGTGDDIVDQWADRVMLAMQFTVNTTVAQAAAKSAADSPRDESVRLADTGAATETEKPAPPAVEKYCKIYACGNCGCLQGTLIAKGTRAPAAVTCERCGCQT
jgi:hypothetical protein